MHKLLGRAGRPQFDDFGIAIIMTSNQDRMYYENVTVEAEIVESTLQSILVEAICAEITQTVIEDISQAILWLKNTYFYVRVTKNPVFYGFQSHASTEMLENTLLNICRSALDDLSTAKIIQRDEMGYLIKALPEAFIMTRHLIRFKTMKLIMNIPAINNIQQLIYFLSAADETQKPVRRNEKHTLNSLMKTIKFPLQEKVQDSKLKSYVLLQVFI